MINFENNYFESSVLKQVCLLV